MKQFEITVIETCRTTYTVEAPDKEEANERFAEWADKHQEWISDDLLNNSCGWEYTDAVEVHHVPDISYEELIKNTQ